MRGNFRGSFAFGRARRTLRAARPRPRSDGAYALVQRQRSKQPTGAHTSTSRRRGNRSLAKSLSCVGDAAMTSDTDKPEIENATDQWDWLPAEPGRNNR